jgi:Putative heavy-metal-binding
MWWTCSANDAWDQQFSSRGDTRWNCPCGYSYNLRRCSLCRVVSNVRSLQRHGEPWVCVWCKAANDGYSRRDDPATAALGDLAADMASHGLEFASREPQQEQARDTLPVLIVTANEVPGCRITQVHGDVFGLIVRARNAFSNMGAQLWGKLPDGPVSSRRCWRLHSRS